MESSANPMDPVEKLNGLTSGFQGAFALGLIFIVVAFIVSLFLKEEKKGVKVAGFYRTKIKVYIKRHLYD